MKLYTTAINNNNWFGFNVCLCAKVFLYSFGSGHPAVLEMMCSSSGVGEYSVRVQGREG